jgi:2-oxoacid:acceptor oxidoreductase gamma subunit (pyruvate/2-ketoisovalerate family)
MLYEFKLYGRGGQGIVTAGEWLAKAAAKEGKHSQSVPSFGSERRGGPSQCSLRISDEPILLKYSVINFDQLYVFDPSIWKHVNVIQGMKDNAVLVFNSTLSPQELKEELTDGKHGYSLEKEARIYTIDATGIALKAIGKAITNTTMMGAFSAITGLISLNSIIEVVKTYLPKDLVESNIHAMKEAYEIMEKQMKEV